MRTHYLGISRYIEAAEKRPPDKQSIALDAVVFTLKEFRALMFAGLFFTLLLISKYWTLGLPRYDFLLLGAIVLQAFLIITKYETKAEALTIVIFHLLGIIMELFKTHPSIHSWAYPEEAYTKFIGVPLYAGFMYAAVGSYIMRVWKELSVRLICPPEKWMLIVLCGLIYVNFFAHHYFVDSRYILILLLCVLCLRSRMGIRPVRREYVFPLPIIFLAMGMLIWIAENIATYMGAWKYAHQFADWHLVSPQKIIAWSLLSILSLTIVAVRQKAWNRA